MINLTLGTGNDYSDWGPCIADLALAPLTDDVTVLADNDYEYVDPLEITGIDTDGHTLHFTAAAGQSFQDQDGTPQYYDQSKGVGTYPTNRFTPPVSVNGVSGVTISRLQFKCADSPFTGICSLASFTGAVIRDCIVGRETSPAFSGESLFSVNADCHAINTLFYQSADSGDSQALRGSDNANLTNCAIINRGDPAASTAIGDIFSGDNMEITNCSFFGWNSAGDNAITNNCATDLASGLGGTAEGSGNVYGLDFADEYVSDTDFTPKAGNSLQAGQDTSAITGGVDIMGDTQPTPYFIGQRIFPSGGGGALVGVDSFTFTCAGVLSGAGQLVGAAALVFTESGVLRGAGALAGTDAIVFADSGVLLGAGALIGSASLVFSDAGTLTGAAGAMNGSASLVFSDAGTLLGAGALVGLASITLADVGVLLGAGALVGADAMLFTDSGSLTGAGVLVGADALTFTDVGALLGAGALIGSAALVFSDSGVLEGAGFLVGSAALTLADSGTLTNAAAGGMTGSDAMTFTDVGVLRGAGALAGVDAMAFNDTGILGTPGVLVGSAAMAFNDTGALLGAGRLVGVGQITFTDDGLLRGTGRLIGLDALAFSDVGTLQGGGGMSGAAHLQFTDTGYLVDSATTILSTSAATLHLKRKARTLRVQPRVRSSRRH